MRSAKMKWELALLLIGLAVFHPTAVKGKGSAEEFQRPLLSVEYEYSRSGQITGRKINGRKQSYQYDRKGQLLGVYDENGKALEEYVYDPAGNILKKTIHGRTTTYKYDKANQLVSSERDGKVTKYEYDAAGRLVKEDEKVYDYIGLDKLSSVSENGRELSSFSYDISGQLAEAVTPEKRETFQWDGLALIQRDSTCYMNEPSITGGNPILADGRVLFNDMLGTTLGIKDGDKVTQNNLSAFGESLSASTMEDSFFTGKPHVGEMGYAFLFRAYRADQGKWQTADPLGYPDGWNNFTYCENHASWEIDFMGLISDDYAGNALKIWENLCSAPQTTPYLYEIRNGYYNALTKRNPFDTVINAVETVNNNIDSVNKILSYNPYGVLPDNWKSELNSLGFQVNSGVENASKLLSTVQNALRLCRQ